MEHLQIHNWDKWQTYRKDRGQPPWIKVHRRIMRNPEWVSLTDAERGQLVAIWLLAADHDGVIPASPELIQKLCFMTKPPNLNKFIQLSFLSSNGCQDGVKMASSGSQDDTPKAKAKAKAEADKNIYGDHVKLTTKERQKLDDDFGTEGALKLIEKLDHYLGADLKRLKKYTSHNHVLRGWVADGLNLQHKRAGPTRITCPSCKQDLVKSDLKDGKCPVCGRKIP